MRLLLILGLGLLVSSSAFADKHGHSLGSHEHGAVTLGIAIDGQTIELELEGPAESFLGFEHAPVNQKDKNIFTQTKSLWESKKSELIKFDSKLGCVQEKAKFEQIIEGNHSEIEASATFLCKMKPDGSVAVVNFKNHFSGIKKLKVEVVGKQSKEFNIKEKSQKINL